MTLRELQNIICGKLNGIEALVQGGCRAFAEDDRTCYPEADQWVSCGKVALVVVTPDAERSGSGSDALPSQVSILIRCIEKPQIASSANVMRALDAAQIVSHELDDESLEWRSIQQRAAPDRQGNLVVTATVTLETNIMLTRNEPNERN